MFIKLALLSALMAVALCIEPEFVTPSYSYTAAPSPAPFISYTAAPKLVAPAPVISYAAPKVYAPTSYVSYAAPKVYAPAPIVAPAPVVAPAPIVSYPAVPAVKTYVPVAHEEVDPNPSYSFSYGVSSPETGDYKSAAETLHDGVVEGHYSLTESDGSVRTVKYVADKINGFNAVVEKTAAKVAAVPVVKAVPAYVAHEPVVSYASPYSYIHKK